VDVALVVLPATVVRPGKVASSPNPGEQDLEVYEDGVPQRIRLFRDRLPVRTRTGQIAGGEPRLDDKVAK
jgi:hypothetical protein